jgi:hypothetical protein
MRPFDKKQNITKANILAEQRYLQSKGLINEERFGHWERQYEELLKNREINNFVTKFQKYRDNVLSNVELEIKPAFSNVIVRFIDKSIPSTAGRGKFWDPKVNGPTDSYETGQIMFQYNDMTCIFSGVDEGNSVKYTFDKSFRTKHNVPWTKEGRELTTQFENHCKGFSFNLLKEEVPTSFYGSKK